ncbi:hypothetical protein DV737_g4817, partial [Chaetothyriales sp. CBS 132003]
MIQPNLYNTPTALPPIGDGPPSLSTVSKSLNVQLVAADNTSTTLGEALARTERKKVLVILIRHFYCTSCQEYIRQISKSLGPEKLRRCDTSIIIVGCGAPSLIAWYVKVTQCAYPIYADPKTRLYKLLGTHRTVSMGMRRPSYVQHSLLMGCVRSIVQGIKRIAAGDQGVDQDDGVGVASAVEEGNEDEDEEYDLWGERKWSESGLNALQSHGYVEKMGFLAGAEGYRDDKNKGEMPYISIEAKQAKLDADA